jgi:nitrogenase molybdenum-iron protein alpha chain
MSIYTALPEVEVRERRLKSVISYNGTAQDLYEKSKEVSLPCGDRSYSQCAGCSEGCAFAVSHIRDTVVIFHAPVGCDAGGMITYAIGIKGSAIARKEKPCPLHLLSTNIQEKDTIFGAAEKLKDAIREADRRFRPKAIFVSTSCASGIIGEDIEAVADEMDEELGYPIAPIYCEGFKSKIWSSGFDSTFHSILRKIVKPPVKKQEDLINVFNFQGTNSTITPLLSRMGLRVNYLISLISLEELETISEAACSTTICETMAMYVVSALEEQYGVPEVKSPAPYGLDWTDAWLRAIGKITHREELAEQVIDRERAKYKDELEDLREKLGGKKLYVFSGDSYAHNLANVGRCLGLEIVGITALHHDQLTDNPESINSLNALIGSKGDVPNFSICNMQPHQVIKILQKLHPDVLLCRHPGLAAVGSKLGIPSLHEGDTNYSVGYLGTVRMGKRIYEAIQTKKLVENVARHVKLPYSDWWLEQPDPFYFGGISK